MDKKRVEILFPPAMLEATRRLASELGLDVSNYVRSLVTADMGKRKIKWQDHPGGDQG